MAYSKITHRRRKGSRGGDPPAFAAETVATIQAVTATAMPA